MNCVFCEIISGDSPADIVYKDDFRRVIAFKPLNPVTEGHILVVPYKHVQDALEDSWITAKTMQLAAELAPFPCNIITSAGTAATQSIFHLHIHIVPRQPGDDLQLPWG